MNSRQTELSYRKVAVANASSVGLVIALYDMLVEDLRQAMKALERGDIEARSRALKHSFLVLQQLQGSLNREKGGDAANHLSHFYAVLRAGIWEAHVQQSPELLRKQISLLLDVRQTWVQVDPERAPAETIPAPTSPSHAPARIGPDDERTTDDWTA
ncbi:MAG TPA: flagellar export chaperone FliS [Terriglobales bacterium]|nr:flagellar export chaperone FliS [Terriglobales bacterium]